MHRLAWWPGPDGCGPRSEPGPLLFSPIVAAFFQYLVPDPAGSNTRSVTLESAHSKLQGQFDSLALTESSLEEQVTKMKAQCIELESLKENIEKLRSWKEVEQVNRAKLEAEVAFKTDMIDRLMSEKNRNTSGPTDKASGYQSAKDK